jgi:hypothetical protein
MDLIVSFMTNVQNEGTKTDRGLHGTMQRHKASQGFFSTAIDTCMKCSQATKEGAYQRENEIED